MAGQFTEEPKMDRITQDAMLPIQIIHTYVCVRVCVCALPTATFSPHFPDITPGYAR